MPNFCKNCGQPLNPDARFCPKCGQPVGQAAQPTNTYSNNNYQQQPYAQRPPQQVYQYGGQPPYQPPYQQPPKKKWTPGKIILIVVLVLIMSAVFGFRRYEKMRQERIEQRMELSKSVIKKPVGQDDGAEKLDATSENIDKNIENEVQAQELEKGEGSSEIIVGEVMVKDEDFFGVVVPIPDIGVVSKDVFQGDSTARSVYFNDISYEQYVDYCKQLEALPGWKADNRWNVANLPEDHNERSARCIGVYQSMYVSLDYYDDKYAERSGGTNLKLYVTSYE